MGGKGNMKKKNIGILVVMLFALFISTTSLEATGNIQSRENEGGKNYKWFSITFVNGVVENISEITIDDIVYYNCTAVDVSWTQILYVFPLWLRFENEHVEDSDDFFIMKALFYGLMREGQILGFIINYGET